MGQWWAHVCFQAMSTHGFLLVACPACYGFRRMCLPRQHILYTCCRQNLPWGDQDASGNSKSHYTRNLGGGDSGQHAIDSGGLDNRWVAEVNMWLFIKHHTIECSSRNCSSRASFMFWLDQLWMASRWCFFSASIHCLAETWGSLGHSNRVFLNWQCSLHISPDIKPQQSPHTFYHKAYVCCMFGATHLVCDLWENCSAIPRTSLLRGNSIELIY